MCSRRILRLSPKYKRFVMGSSLAGGAWAESYPMCLAKLGHTGVPPVRLGVAACNRNNLGLHELPLEGRGLSMLSAVAESHVSQKAEVRS
jgi:hypothetical protein